MKAVQFDLRLSRYALVKSLGRWFPSLHWHPKLSCLRYQTVPEPTLPNEQWAKIKVKYAGICGSDLNLIFLRDSPATSPFASFPFTLGHEIVGTVEETGSAAHTFKPGDRVVIDPVLSCKTRGFDSLCPACAKGDESLCERMTDGNISPGLLIGTCRDTGGGWGSHLVAHQSQLIKLPDDVNDLNGVMVEPFSCALHSVLRNPPGDGDHVLIIGSGVIGICTIAALRALNDKCQITVVAKHDFQAELAARYGADQIIRLAEEKTFERQLADVLQAKLLKPVFGPSVVQGGADLVYECVGNAGSIKDALRFCRSGGKVVLVGLAGIQNKIDWTAVWLNELEIKGCFAYSTEYYKGKQMRTLQIAIDLMQEGKVDLAPMVTHTFPLHDYQKAIEISSSKARGQTMKVVFEP